VAVVLQPNNVVEGIPARNSVGRGTIVRLCQRRVVGGGCDRCAGKEAKHRPVVPTPTATAARAMSTAAAARASTAPVVAAVHAWVPCQPEGDGGDTPTMVATTTRRLLDTMKGKKE
jgi:hypothetical protein